MKKNKILKLAKRAIAFMLIFAFFATDMSSYITDPIFVKANEQENEAEVGDEEFIESVESGEPTESVEETETESEELEESSGMEDSEEESEPVDETESDEIDESMETEESGEAEESDEELESVEESEEIEEIEEETESEEIESEDEDTQVLTTNVDGTSVSLYSDFFVFPEGTVLQGSEITSSEMLERIALQITDTLLQEDNDLYGYMIGDIGLYDLTVLNGEGNTVDLDGNKVSVRLADAAREYDDSQAVQVFYVDERSGELHLTSMDTFVDGEDVVFETDHFSLYAVVRMMSGLMMDSRAVDKVIGQIIWNEGELWEDLIRPTNPKAEEVKGLLYLYSKNSSGILTKIDLQTTNSSADNYLNWRPVSGEGLWNYDIFNIDVPDNHVKFVIETGGIDYYKQVQTEINEGVVDFGKIYIEPEFCSLTIKKALGGSVVDNTKFSFDVKLGKTETGINTPYPTEIASIPADETGVSINIPKGLWYEVTEKPNDIYIPSYDANRKKEITSNIDTIVTNLKNDAKITLNKVWNDNNDLGRMDVSDWITKLKIYYYLDNDLGENNENLKPLDKDALPIIGIKEVPTINQVDVKVTSFNNWSITLKNEGSENFPAYTKDGKSIIYVILEEGMNDYIKSGSEFNADRTITNTKIAPFEGTIEWNDVSIEEEKTERPENISIELYRYTNNNRPSDDDEPFKIIVVEPSNEGNEWFFSINNLPMYDEDGNYYTYYAKQGAINSIYQTVYDNHTGPQGNINTELYHEGTIKNTLVETIDFKVNKIWLDEPDDKRPEGVLCLYRYAENNGIENAAPVAYRKADGTSVIINEKLKTDEDSYTTDFQAAKEKAGITKFEKYDENGERYVYFVKEILYVTEENGNYTKRYDNKESTEKGKYINDLEGAFNNGNIINAKDEMMDFEITKRWAIGAQQDSAKNMTVYLDLEYSIKDKDDWKKVEEHSGANGIIISDFSAAIMEKSVTIELPNYIYNDESKEYEKLEYQVTETKVTEKDANGYIHTLELDKDNIFTSLDGKRYQFEHGKVDPKEPSKLIAINRLVGELDYDVTKKWNGGLQGDAWVEMELWQTTKSGDSNLIESIRLDGKENPEWNTRISNLEKYDKDGYEYSYDIKEVNFDGTSLGGEKYVSSYTTYTKIIEDEKEVWKAVVNNYVEGKSKYFWVDKIWLDDDDVQYRENVYAQLYYITNKENSEYKKVTNNDGSDYIIELTEMNNWRNHFEINADIDIKDYFVREVRVGADGFVDYDGSDEDNFDLFSGLGEVKTSEHIYEVTHSPTVSTTGNSASSTITNRRIGELSIHIEKIWKDGGTANDKRPDIFIILYANDEEKERVSLKNDKDTDKNSEKNIWYYTFKKLPKYDSTGKIISYRIEEVISDTGENKNQSEIQYVSKVEIGEYISGPSHHTNDQLNYKVTNTREGKTEYTVYKKWKDKGNTGLRPNIYVSLYFQVDKADGTKSDMMKYANLSEGNPYYDSVWVGVLDYYWQESEFLPQDHIEGKDCDSFCNIKNLNAYTEDGEKINYYSKETMLNGKEYEIYYSNTYTDSSYSNLPLIPDGTDIYAEDKSFIINKLEDKLIINGIKLWKNLQSKTDVSDFTKPKIDLYRYIGVRGDNDENLEYMATTHLDKENTKFVFEGGMQPLNDEGEEDENAAPIPRLDKYNKEGEIYYYVIKETMPGKMSRVYQNGVSVFELTNEFIIDENNNRDIEVVKKWVNIDKNTLDKTGLLEENQKYPVLTFDLFRIKASSNWNSEKWDENWKNVWTTDYFNNSANIYQTKKIEIGKDDIEEVIISFDKLLVWAEDGEQYQYAIRERNVNGYSTTITPNSPQYSVNSTLGTVIIFAEKEYDKIEDVPKTVKKIEIDGDKEKEIIVKEPSSESITNSYNNESGVDEEQKPKPNDLTILGSKKWEDQNNEQLRPDSLVLKVYRWAPGDNNGNTIDKHELRLGTDFNVTWTVQPAGTDGYIWRYEITGSAILKYAPNGKAYQYSVEEVPPTYYTTSSAIVSGSHQTKNGKSVYEMEELTNRLNVEHKVTKKWDDDGDKYALRPTYVIVKLQRKLGNGTWEDVPWTLSGENIDSKLYEWKENEKSILACKLEYNASTKDWSYTFKNLPLTSTINNNDTYTYRAVECAIGKEYEKESESGKETVNEIYPIDNINLTGNGLTYSYEAGAYTSSHVVAESSDNKHGSTAISNKLRATSLAVIKIWIDKDNIYDSRPGSFVDGEFIPEIEMKVQVRYKEIGGNYTDLLDASGKPVVLSLSGTGNTISNTFENLPVCDMAGKEYEYRAVEVKDNLHNYDVKIIPIGDALTGFTTTLTNTLIEDENTCEITAEKVWLNGSAFKGITDDTIQFELIGYIGSKDGNDRENIDYTNKPIITLRGKGPEGNTDNLLQYEYEAWKAKWRNLPKVNNYNKPINYEVVEISDNKFKEDYIIITEQDVINPQHFTITNILTTSLTVSKNWMNDSNDIYDSRSDIIVELERRIKTDNNSNPYTSVSYQDIFMEGEGNVKTVLTAENWTHKFERLPQYGIALSQDGREEVEYEYRAVEVALPNYTHDPSENAITEYDAGKNVYTTTLTNHLIKGSLTIQKIWADDGNRDGIRPVAIKVRLLQNGVSHNESVEVVLDAAESNTGIWEYTFNDLPVYSSIFNDSGEKQKIEYSIEEIAIKEGENWVDFKSIYNVSYVGNGVEIGDSTTPVIKVTNTQKDYEKVGKTVTKEWKGEDSNLISTSRLENITLYLKMKYKDADGEEVEAYVDSSDDSYGKPIAVDDDANKDKRLKITLDGTESTSWTHTWSGLYVNSNETGTSSAAGEPSAITYFVEEDPVPKGYNFIWKESETNTNQINAINTLDSTELSVIKIWDDQTNKYNSRPEKLTIHLQQRLAEEEGNAATPWATVATEKITVTVANQEPTFTFKNLPKCNSEGKKYEYQVIEDVPHNYTNTSARSNIDGTDTITLTNTLQTGKLSISKVWNDDSNRDSKRPKAIRVVVMQDNNELVKEELSANSNEWNLVLEDLPIYQKPNPSDSEPVKIQYSVKEVEVEVFIDNEWKWISLVNSNPGIEYDYEYTINYSGAVSLDKTKAIDTKITNTYQPGITNRTVTKVWGPTNAVLESMIRPESVDVNLWMEYTDNMGTTHEGYVNNNYEPSNSPTTFSKKTLNPDNNWNGEWSNLPKKVNIDGVSYPITYTVKEDQVTGYKEPVITNGLVSTTITNNLSTTQHIVDKNWVGDDATTRPDKISIKLQWSLDGINWADIDEIGTIDLVSSNNWSHTFSNIPKYGKNGAEYKYRAVEINVPDNYIHTETDAITVDGKTTLTNTLLKDSLTVTKVWNDADDRDGVRPDSIRIELLQNGIPYSTPVYKDITKSDWKVIFTDLPVYYPPNESGALVKISYRVREVIQDENGNWIPYQDEEGDYQVTYSSTGIELDGDLKASPQNITITNIHEVEKIDKMVRKIWGNQLEPENPLEVSVRPDSITVYLTMEYTKEDGTTVTSYADANGNPVDKKSAAAYATLSSSEIPDENWTHTWKNLYKYINVEGKSLLITYKVEESIKGYLPAVTIVKDDIILTNNLDATQLTVTKEWVDQENRFNSRPTNITVVLEQREKKAIRLFKENDWTPVDSKEMSSSDTTITFANLPKYSKDGKEYEYRAVETPVPPNYKNTDKTTGDITTGFETKLTNTLVTGSLVVEKIWKDDENRDGKRFEEIQIEVLQNGSSFDNPFTIELNDTNGWKDEIDNLPIYQLDLLNSEPQKITYNIQEKIKNYQGEWEVYNDSKGVYKVTYSDSVVLNEGSSEEITVTNAYDYEVTSKIVVKSWKDDNRTEELQKSVRPDEITIYLKMKYEVNGESKESYVDKTYNPIDTDDMSKVIQATLTESDWTYTFEKLPKYINLEDTIIPVDYTVVEKPVNGYLSEVVDKNEDGAIEVINTLDAVKLTAEKIWNDQSNFYQSRPTEITVKLEQRVAKSFRILKQNGWKEVDSQKIVDPATSITFNNLPKCNQNGDNYEYRIVEVPVPQNYDNTVSNTTSVEGGLTSILTNTLITGSLTVNKVWKDDENRDGKRPEVIRVELYQKDGENFVATGITGEITGSGSYTFTDLPVYLNPEKNNNAFIKAVYSVREVAIKMPGADNWQEFDSEFNYEYTISYTDSKELNKGKEEKITITNTLQIGLTDKTVTKLWDENEYLVDSVRPENVTVYLKMKYTDKNGNIYEGYVDQENNYIISQDPTDYATVELRSGSTGTANWSHTWKELPTNINHEGTTYPITYFVEEDQVTGYEEPEYSVNSAGELVITNPLDATILSVQKVWEDESNIYKVRPDVITVILEQRLKDQDPEADWTDTEVKQIPVSSDTDTIDIEFTQLPKCNQDGGKYEYRVREEAVTSYLTEYIYEEDGSVTINNQLETISVSGKKIWEEEHDNTSIRPDEIIFAVYETENPQPLAQQTVTEEENWEYIFNGLPRYKKDNQDNIVLYEYYIIESTVPYGYIQTLPEDGKAYGTRTTDSLDNIVDADITNTLDVFHISGTKIWNDYSDKYHVRPDNIQLKITYTVDDSEVDSEHYELVWNKDNSDNWVYTIQGLPRIDTEGNLISYTIEELPVEGYIMEGDTIYTDITATEDDITDIDFTNTLRVGNVSIEKKFKPGESTNDKFRFTVTLWDKEAPEDAFVYTGDYNVYNSQTNEWLRKDTSKEDGIMAIAVGERLETMDMAAGLLYEVEEKQELYYMEDSTNGYLTGTLGENVKHEVTYTNKKIILLGILNTTPNPSIEHNKNNAGGWVNVMLTSSGRPSDAEYDLDKPDQMEVAWQPEINWLHTSSFSMMYKETENDTEWKTIEINDYLDSNGMIKPMSSPVYNDLREVYPEAVISQDPDTLIITLTLAHTVENMMKHTNILVQFAPTLAVENITREHEGGVVSVAGGIMNHTGDGLWNVDGKSPYEATTVYGVSEEGYVVDTQNLTISNLRAPEGVISDMDYTNYKIEPDENGRFETIITTIIADEEVDVLVTGTVIETIPKTRMVVQAIEETKKITSISIELDALPIPLEIGIPFVPDETGGEEPEVPEEPGEPEEPNNGENGGNEDNTISDVINNINGQTDENTTSGIPPTGDNTPIGWITMIEVLAFASSFLIFASKRRRKGGLQRKNEK